MNHRPCTPWTEQEIAILTQLYPNETISNEQMEQRFSRPWSTIKDKARQLKVYRRTPRLSCRQWTEADETVLRELYPDPHISRDQIAKVLGRSWRSIQHRIGYLDLERPSNNPNSVQRDYFKVIDSNEKAYWLGFLAADGAVYIGGRQHSLRLDLQPRDRHWLERFRDTIAPGAKITQHGQRSFSVSIGSKDMVNDLVTLGITPRKSNTLVWPKVPEAFVLPFLLGCFDGDGSFQKRSIKGRYLWTLLGTQPLLTQARYYIQLYTGIPMREPVRACKHTSPHLYRIHAYSANAALLDRTLNASGLGLPRKHLPLDLCVSAPLR